MPIQLYQLALAILGVLIVASIASRALRARDPDNPVLLNLVQRVNAWWIMTGCIALAFFCGRLGVILLFFLCSFAALREFLSYTFTRRGDHWALMSVFLFFLPAQYFLIWLDWYGLYSIFIPVYGFLFLPILAALRGDVWRFLERIGFVQLSMMICIYCISHAPALMDLHIPGFQDRQILLLTFLIVVAQGSDILQYIFGKTCGAIFGGHKIAPRLSPSKTWEGFALGALGATGLGALLSWCTPFTAWGAAGMAFMIALMGFLGGLVMSAIKRDRGVKDWGHMIAGHGGMLDRIDGMIFAAPIFFHLTRYWCVV